MALTLSNNRYHIIRALVNGSSASFLAEDLEQVGGGYYTIKRLKLPPVDPQTEQLIQHSFYQRIAALKELSDTGEVAGLRDYFTEGGYLYLVRDWVEGTPLSDRALGDNRWDEAEVSVLLYQLLELLSEIHDRQTFHGSIKPSNIILSHPQGIPKLVDFNLLPMLVEVPVAAPVGAPEIAAIAPIGFNPPERLTGHIFCSSDLYSLGLAAIYWLTGKSPQELQPNPQTGMMLWRHFAPQVTPELAHIIDTAIQPQPTDRYLTATEMLEALQAIVPPSAIQTRLGMEWDWGLTVRRGMAVAAIAAVLLGGYFFIKQRLQPALLPTNPPAVVSPTVDTPSSNPAETSSETLSETSFTEAEAVRLVGQWLQSKARIFSPPFDRTLAAELTTTPLYADIAETGGAIEWLQQNNARYEFRTSQIESTEQFAVEGDRALLDVTITEDRTLYIGDRVDSSKTGTSTSRVRYDLRWVDGAWKVADYQDVPLSQ